MNIITTQDVTKAIEKKLNITAEEAKKIATLIMDMFGYDDRIIDNGLDQTERQLFYRLEAEGILSTAREEIVLQSGQSWRIHYWILQKLEIAKCVNGKDRITVVAKKKPVHILEKYPDHTIYSSLSKDTWTTRKLPST